MQLETREFEAFLFPQEKPRSLSSITALGQGPIQIYCRSPCAASPDTHFVIHEEAGGKGKFQPPPPLFINMYLLILSGSHSIFPRWDRGSCPLPGNQPWYHRTQLARGCPRAPGHAAELESQNVPSSAALAKCHTFY